MQNTLNLETLADHIIAIANQKNQQLTDMQLQGLLYLALTQLCQTNVSLAQKIYHNEVYVTSDGPIAITVYHKYHHDDHIIINDDAVQNGQFIMLNDTIISNLSLTQLQLQKLTTSTKFYQQNYQNHHNIQYRLDDFK